MATEVKYIKDSNIEQLSHEQNMITDVLKAKVKSSSGKLRNIKLPKYIFLPCIKRGNPCKISLEVSQVTVSQFF